MVCNIAGMLEDANARNEVGCGGVMSERYMEVGRVTDCVEVDVVAEFWGEGEEGKWRF